ncbi:uncharacterized protein PODANS_3_180 [Podospora anserina S mat+]|uniref:Podospora anserina S mat+ genomic DNA chromosome 3, supercontig 1 n=1 Tax=Podospora anserina (strain S / ATCC MYA-4624 / DSM 980 / FGSC 10383) TaxID=515849 RepID=B2AC82_PODAN|nr:uncharacterized protein PODANS_3_180 [Podospora anserina S mat+]CAP61047.1 unnamed protein product [Podospora anserina S mat+]CDP26499.1 Putative protein of unknown function [Podospora anserina S mat+]
MNHQHRRWPLSAQGERPRLSLQTASPTENCPGLPPYPVNDQDARLLVASKLWGEQRRFSDSFSQMSNEALYHESLDKLNLSCRTGLSFNFREQTEQEAQFVVDLGGSVTHIPSPQPSPTFKPAGLPSRAALTYTPANAKTYPSAEWELTNDKPQAKGDGFMLWKEYAPVILTRRSSSLQSEREQVLDAVSSLGLKGPVKGLGKLSRPVLNKYYRTEQALAEFLIKQDRVLLRPLPSPETGQRELERLETDLFDTSKYMGSTNYMTVLTWSDDNPWGTITLFQVETPLMGSVSQGGYLESQRRKPPNLHVHVREPFATKIKPVAAMEHIPQQVLVNMRMDTAIRKLVLVHEQNSQRFRWMAKGEMGHPSYATLYRPDMTVPIAVQRSLYEHLDADEAAILGHHSQRRPSCLSPQAAYQDRQEVTADGIVATIPQFLALLHSTQSIVEVASSPKLSDEERVETTSGERFRRCSMKQPLQGKRHTGRDVHVVVLLPASRSAWVEEKLFWTDEQGHLAEFRQKRYKSVIDRERDRRRGRCFGEFSGRRGRSPGVGEIRSPPLSATLCARDSVWYE